MTTSKNGTNPKLYIMKQEPDGPYKVGVSNNPMNRLSTIQVGNPNKVSLLETINSGTFCARTIETKTMNILSSYNVWGEWFDAPPETIKAAMDEALRSSDRRFVIHIAEKTATPKWVDLIPIAMLKEEARNLSVKSGFKFAVDYIVPLSHHLVCGLHIAENMRIVSNAHKGRYREDEWTSIKEEIKNPHDKVLEIKGTSNRYDALIARDSGLTKWVIDNSGLHQGYPFKQRIHDALTGENSLCKHGKLRQYRSSFGYTWCSLPHCRCKLDAKRGL
jgi:hypothetical protein